MDFTDQQLQRYARHIVLPEVGGIGQEKLLNARVLVIGAGGLGAPLPPEAAAPSAADRLAVGLGPEFVAWLRTLTYADFCSEAEAVAASLREEEAKQRGGKEGGAVGREVAEQGQEGRPPRAAAAAASPSKKATAPPPPPPPPVSASLPALSPWQERHALCALQAVPELDELRFVLCPRRMRDRLFWACYFRLARGRLPEGALEPGAAAPALSPQGLLAELALAEGAGAAVTR